MKRRKSNKQTKKTRERERDHENERHKKRLWVQKGGHTLKQADLANALHRRMRTLKTSDLLILDDFAFKKLDQQSAEYFYMIVDARYATKSIILTSNRALSDWDTSSLPGMTGALELNLAGR